MPDNYYSSKRKNPHKYKMMYLLERTRDSETWPKGTRIWAFQPCKGWRVIDKHYVLKTSL